MKVNVGDEIRLVGKTIKGRNRINSYGDLWRITRIIRLSVGDPAAHIISLADPEYDRWITLTTSSEIDDKDFKLAD